MSAGLRPVRGTAEEILGLLREWDAADSTAPLVIETSGSTGQPKRVVLARDALRASAQATHERLGGPGRWVLNLPPTYVAGLQVLYRGVLAGTEPVLFDGSWSTTLADVTGRCYVSLVPTQLVRLLQDPACDREVAALARATAVLVGGGPLDPRVRDLAEERGLRLVQTYGMSETCGGCVYDGVPLAGCEVRIEEDGAVLLRGPMLFDGYAGEPERTAAVLRDGWFRTHDRGHWEGGRLRIDGRADDVIISGGVKVPAPAVAAAVAAHGAVTEVEVVGVPDDEWGERVVAVVAAQDPVSLASVRDLVSPRAWAPRQLVVLDALPLLANGKVDRVALRELAARG